jgi:hypothetical protein
MKFAKQKSVAFRIICDEGFVVETKEQLLHQLNPTGAYLWQLIMDGVPSQELARRLTEHFDIDEQTAHADVEEFIHQLRRHRLIEETA